MRREKFLEKNSGIFPRNAGDFPMVSAFDFGAINDFSYLFMQAGNKQFLGTVSGSRKSFIFVKAVRWCVHLLISHKKVRIALISFSAY